MYNTITEIKKANAKIGDNWFSKGAMRFFNTKIVSKVIGGRYFITSEQYKNEDISLKVMYTIREAFEDGSIEMIGKFQQYIFIDDAHDAIKLLVKTKALR